MAVTKHVTHVAVTAIVSLKFLMFVRLALNNSQMWEFRITPETVNLLDIG